MIHGGLFTLQPKFVTDERAWATKVNSLRQDIVYSSSQSITDEKRQATIKIASPFESGYRLPMVAHLMSLLPHRSTKKSVLTVFRTSDFDGRVVIQVTDEADHVRPRIYRGTLKSLHKTINGSWMATF